MLPPPPPAAGPPVFTNEYKDGNAAPYKWVIPVVVVGVTTLVSAVLLVAVWWKGRHGGGRQPYMNVHMIKMMAESGGRSGQLALQNCIPWIVARPWPKLIYPRGYGSRNIAIPPAQTDLIMFATEVISLD